MNSFTNRLNEALDKSGLSKAELARRTGIGRNSITDYTKGKYDAKQDNVYLIATALKVSPAWLMGYDVPANQQEGLVDIFGQLEKSRQQKVYDFASDQLEQQNNPHKNNITKFPNRVDDEKADYDVYSDVEIYGAASAGPGEILMDEHTDTITYHGYVPKHDYALIVNGNSMEPLFADQQVIFVDKTEEAYNGQIVIAYLNGNAYVKKLWISSDKCELVSLNPDYKPIEISKDDDFCIDGVVVL